MAEVLRETAAYFKAVRRIKPLWQGVKTAADELDRFSVGNYSDRVGTGIPKLDRRLRGGMRGGEMLLLGAPTGGGKTSLVSQVAMTVAATGPVMVVSPEMSLESLAEREIIRRSARRLWDRNPWTVRGPWRESCEAAHVAAASELVDEKLPLMVLDQSDVTMTEIEQTAREIEGLRLVVMLTNRTMRKRPNSLPGGNRAIRSCEGFGIVARRRTRSHKRRSSALGRRLYLRGHGRPGSRKRRAAARSRWEASEAEKQAIMRRLSREDARAARKSLAVFRRMFGRC